MGKCSSCGKNDLGKLGTSQWGGHSPSVPVPLEKQRGFLFQREGEGAGMRHWKGSQGVEKLWGLGRLWGHQFRGSGGTNLGALGVPV